MTLTLSAKTRQIQGKKVEGLRQKGVLPAVLYGPKTKSENLEINAKEFDKVFSQAGESTLIDLEVEGKKDKYLVLVHDISRDPLSSSPLHVDFYQPDLKQEITVKVPIILEGEAPAVKALGGTLVKNIAEVDVKALPQSLPKEIRLSVAGLNTFEDHVFIKDIKVAEGVKILKGPGEIVAHVAPVEKVDEELQKPIEEKVEEVEKIEKEKKEKVEEEPVAEEKKEPKPTEKK
jgi:large subunit ribosomal protein L25